MYFVLLSEKLILNEYLAKTLSRVIIHVYCFLLLSICCSQIEDL